MDETNLIENEADVSIPVTIKGDIDFTIENPSNEIRTKREFLTTYIMTRAATIKSAEDYAGMLEAAEYLWDGINDACKDEEPTP